MKDRIRLQRISEEDEDIIKTFQSGNTSLDNMLKNALYFQNCGQRTTYKLETQGAIIGFVMSHPIVVYCEFEQDICYQDECMFPCLHIDFLVVDEEFRRESYGKEMLHQTIAQAQKLANITSFCAITIQSLEKDWLRAFYLSMGFDNSAVTNTQFNMFYKLSP